MEPTNDSTNEPSDIEKAIQWSINNKKPITFYSALERQLLTRQMVKLNQGIVHWISGNEELVIVRPISDIGSIGLTMELYAQIFGEQI